MSAARRSACFIRCGKINKNGGKKGVNGRGETLTVMLEELCLTFTESGRIELRGYHSTAMIIKSLQVCPPLPGLVSLGPILHRNVNDDESPRRLGGDEGLISLSLGEQAADDYRPQSSAA